tara:strand:- start:12271 stop:12882 length:612 start_codon:yes stop_codon:yes gene_type:complete
MAFVTNLAGTLYYNRFVDGYPSGVDNDQGNIRAGGTIAESNLFTSSALGEQDRFVILSSGAGGTTGVIAPSTATTFNQYDQLGDIVKVTTTLAGVSNTSLLFGASDSADQPSIHQRAVIRSLDYKTSIVAGNWNAFSGAFSPALSTTIAGGWNIIGGVEQGGTLVSDKTDKAANPSQEEPGHLAYMVGNPIPTTGLYARRTNW